MIPVVDSAQVKAQKRKQKKRTLCEQEDTVPQAKYQISFAKEKQVKGSSELVPISISTPECVKGSRHQPRATQSSLEAVWAACVDDPRRWIVFPIQDPEPGNLWRALSPSIDKGCHSTTGDILTPLPQQNTSLLHLTFPDYPSWTTQQKEMISSMPFWQLAVTSPYYAPFFAIEWDRPELKLVTNQKVDGIDVYDMHGRSIGFPYLRIRIPLDELRRIARETSTNMFITRTGDIFSLEKDNDHNLPKSAGDMYGIGLQLVNPFAIEMIIRFGSEYAQRIINHIEVSLKKLRTCHVPISFSKALPVQHITLHDLIGSKSSCTAVQEYVLQCGFRSRYRLWDNQISAMVHMWLLEQYPLPIFNSHVTNAAFSAVSRFASSQVTLGTIPNGYRLLMLRKQKEQNLTPIYSCTDDVDFISHKQCLRSVSGGVLAGPTGSGKTMEYLAVALCDPVAREERIRIMDLWFKDMNTMRSLVPPVSHLLTSTFLPCTLFIYPTKELLQQTVAKLTDYYDSRRLVVFGSTTKRLANHRLNRAININRVAGSIDSFKDWEVKLERIECGEDPDSATTPTASNSETAEPSGQDITPKPRVRRRLVRVLIVDKQTEIFMWSNPGFLLEMDMILVTDDVVHKWNNIYPYEFVGDYNVQPITVDAKGQITPTQRNVQRLSSMNVRTEQEVSITSFMAHEGAPSSLVSGIDKIMPVSSLDIVNPGNTALTQFSFWRVVYDECGAANRHMSFASESRPPTAVHTWLVSATPDPTVVRGMFSLSKDNQLGESTFTFLPGTIVGAHVLRKIPHQQYIVYVEPTILEVAHTIIEEDAHNSGDILDQLDKIQRDDATVHVSTNTDLSGLRSVFGNKYTIECANLCIMAESFGILIGCVHPLGRVDSVTDMSGIFYDAMLHVAMEWLCDALDVGLDDLQMQSMMKQHIALGLHLFRMSIPVGYPLTFSWNPLKMTATTLSTWAMPLIWKRCPIICGYVTPNSHENFALEMVVSNRHEHLLNYAPWTVVRDFLMTDVQLKSMLDAFEGKRTVHVATISQIKRCQRFLDLHPLWSAFENIHYGDVDCRERCFITKTRLAESRCVAAFACGHLLSKEGYAIYQTMPDCNMKCPICQKENNTKTSTDLLVSSVALFPHSSITHSMGGAQQALTMSGSVGSTLLSLVKNILDADVQHGILIYVPGERRIVHLKALFKMMNIRVATFIKRSDGTTAENIISSMKRTDVSSRKRVLLMDINRQHSGIDLGFLTHLVIISNDSAGVVVEHERQALGRLLRLNQKHPVQTFCFVIKDSHYHRVEHKKRNLHEVSMRKHASIDQIKQALRQGNSEHSAATDSQIDQLVKTFGLLDMATVYDVCAIVEK